MIIKAISLSSSAIDTSFMYEIHRMRHRIFVENLGWEDLRKPDWQERDQFDHDGSVHIAACCRGSLVGYARLLPTLRPHLLSHVYPELLQGSPAPRGPRTWEWTRMCSDADHFRGKAPSVGAYMMQAVAEMAVMLDAEQLIAQAHPTWIRRLNRAGWITRELATPMFFNGELVSPFSAVADRATVARSRSRFGIPELTWDLKALDLHQRKIAA